MTLVFTNKLASGSDTDAASYATASYTPTANTLQLIAILNSRNGSPATVPTASGCNLTWEAITNQGFALTGAAPNRRLISVLRAMGANPTTGALTIDMAGVTHTGCQWQVCEVTGMDTSGANGSGAIVQSAVNIDDSNTATTISKALSAFGDSANRGYAVAGHTIAEGSAPRTNWTELADAGTAFTAPTQAMETQWSNVAGADATVSASWSTVAYCAIIGIEVKAAPAASTDAQIYLPVHRAVF